jgi:hypothetical protein
MLSWAFFRAFSILSESESEALKIAIIDRGKFGSKNSEIPASKRNVIIHRLGAIRHVKYHFGGCFGFVLA